MVQGRELAFLSKNPHNISKVPATENSKTLWLLKVIIKGKLLTNPAITAPIPRVIKRAGKAQQRRVEVEVKRLSKVIKNPVFSFFI
ncbi:MAG: hypothetical protein ACK5BE_01080 [Alphaproteobacteria bacterium]